MAWAGGGGGRGKGRGVVATLLCCSPATASKVRGRGGDHHEQGGNTTARQLEIIISTAGNNNSLSETQKDIILSLFSVYPEFLFSPLEWWMRADGCNYNIKFIII